MGTIKVEKEIATACAKLGFSIGKIGKGEPMSDLINRQQAIDVLEEQLDYLHRLNKDENPMAEGKWYGINWARNTIAELPTIDLVTCGECKHFNEETHGCNRNPSVNAWWETDFCSYGEKERR